MLRNSKESIAASNLKVISSLPTRPSPPKDLSPQEAGHWTEICASMPPDFFTRESHAILAAYCRTTVLLSKQAAAIHKSDPSKGKEYDRLVKQGDLLTKQLCLLAAKLRCCPSARMLRSNTVQRGPRLWQDM
jgi:hypothetical protein